MGRLKRPPKIKVYEALSAVSSGRVTQIANTNARVLSSTRNKLYEVFWSEDRRQFASNDNGTFWRGYIGYPIIAVLIQLGELPRDSCVESILADVPWKKVNDRLANDYDAAIGEVLSGLDPRARVVVASHVADLDDRISNLQLCTFDRKHFRKAAEEIGEA